MALITVVIAVAAAALLLPAVSDSLCLLRSLGRRRGRSESGNLPSLLFLVPAHDEEELIGDCVRSLRTLDYPADRSAVVVIADNCSDRTVERAAANGAMCLERRDTARPGKPRAIAWALTQVQLNRHDAVIIIDADTTVDPGFARALSRTAPLEHKAVQAYFDVANPQESALTRLETLLALVEGWVEHVTDAAARGHLPHADAMRETVRRRVWDQRVSMGKSCCRG